MLKQFEQYSSEEALEICGGLMPKKQVIKGQIDPELADEDDD